MRICFISNYHFTPVQIAIAKALRQHGIESDFIAVNRKRRDEILAAGWSEDGVLYLPFVEQPGAAPNTRYPIKFLDILASDRALRMTPQKGLSYLYACAAKMNAHFEERNISHVFGEPTWGHERIAAELCRYRSGMKFLWPHTTRFPSTRWGFFPGGDQIDLFDAFHRDEPDAHAVEFLAAQPAYVKRNDELLAKSQTLLSRLSRVKRFITRENIDADDPTFVHSRLCSIAVAGGEERNRFFYRFVRREAVTDEMLKRPFVLYAMHKQPESSIDVLGRYYENQEELIRAIWRTLPAGWWLYVKEHTNAIGDRSPLFYRRIRRLPNVAVLDERASARSLIEASRAVFTVSGSIAYEASLMKKCAFTFAPMFFNRFPQCNRITIEDLRSASTLHDLIVRHHTHESDEAARKYILRNSFEGLYTDVHTDQRVLNDENLGKLVAAFRLVLAGGEAC